MVVYVDAGHGTPPKATKYPDVGAQAFGRSEADDNFRLANRIIAILNTQPDVEAVATRPTNHCDGPYLAQRVSDANARGGAAFVSIHRNAYKDASARGFSIFTQTKPTNRDEALTAAIHKRVVAAGVSRDRGICRHDFYVCTKPNMASCLVEYLFLTNEGDNALFDQKLDDYATATALGILDYLGLAYVAPDAGGAGEADDPGALDELRAENGWLLERVQLLEAAVGHIRGIVDEV